MIMFTSTLIAISFAQTRTSTNTCTNEKSIFKLDVRQRVFGLPPESNIRDIDAYALCQEAYMYDYIWLHQMWIPGGYNYQKVGSGAQQTNDFKELQSIKEYLIDPELGQLFDLYHFQQNIKNYCPHMKFLGEFSFYISQDSYLLQNRSRFLRRIPTDNQNIYNSRYDNENFVWAVNDQLKTIPYTVAWNYFDQIVLNDMKDIIYRLILQQHKLDGIVFLQPSLGLYDIMRWSFQAEIQFFGTQSLLQDFYENFGLKLNQDDIYYVGGEDNSNTKILLQNYLSQIYGNPSPLVWEGMNYTFTSVGSNIIKVNAKTVKGDNAPFQQANVGGPPNTPNCIIYQIIDNNGVSRFGVVNTNNSRYVIAQSKYLIYDGDSLLNGTTSFKYGSTLDMIEIQFLTSTGQFIFMKYQNDQTNFQQMSMMIPGTYLYLRYISNIGQQASIQIKFPFQFSQIYKNTNLVIQNSQQIALTTYLNQNVFYYAQTWPNINQNENMVTLNFQITSMNGSIAIGVCNQEILQNNNHQLPPTTPFGAGMYVWHSEGQKDVWHNSSTSLNNAYIGKKFGLDLISVSYTKQNQSISFYKNSAYQHTFQVDKVKNLNFCTAISLKSTVVSLVY